MPQTVGRKFLSYNELRDRGIRFSRVHLKRLENTGNFPKRVTIGSGSNTQSFIAWLLEEVEAWEAARIAARDLSG
jgi:predicted DNA-binding transcriptional regulator AlpA